jgi:hypothetical protein
MRAKFGNLKIINCASKGKSQISSVIPSSLKKGLTFLLGEPVDELHSDSPVWPAFSPRNHHSTTPTPSPTEDSTADSEDDFVLVDQPTETESCDSPAVVSSNRPSSVTITGMFGFEASSPPPPTPLSISSTEWNLPTGQYSKRKTGFTGHSRVIFSAGGGVSEPETSPPLSPEQYLSSNPWHWSCPIPRLRILLMAVGTRFGLFLDYHN